MGTEKETEEKVQEEPVEKTESAEQTETEDKKVDESPKWCIGSHY